VIYRDREEESVPHLTGRGELIGDCPSLDQGWVSLVEWLSGVLLNAGSYKNAAIYSVTEKSAKPSEGSLGTKHAGSENAGYVSHRKS